MKEPLCGWRWFRQHRNDLDGWTPKIEIIRPGLKQTITIKNDKALKEVVKVIRQDKQ